MQPFIINLCLGVFWLFLGATILVIEWVKGPLGWRPLDISLGWWFMVLAGYNFIRVVSIRSGTQRRPPTVAEGTTLSRPLGQRLPTDEPPDPNFQFNEPPPPGAAGKEP